MVGVVPLFAENTVSASACPGLVDWNGTAGLARGPVHGQSYNLMNDTLSKMYRAVSNDSAQVQGLGTTSTPFSSAQVQGLGTTLTSFSSAQVQGLGTTLTSFGAQVQGLGTTSTPFSRAQLQGLGTTLTSFSAQLPGLGTTLTPTTALDPGFGAVLEPTLQANLQPFVEQNGAHVYIALETE
eukprot:Em0246g1a